MIQGVGLLAYTAHMHLHFVVGIADVSKINFAKEPQVKRNMGDDTQMIFP